MNTTHPSPFPATGESLLGPTGFRTVSGWAPTDAVRTWADGLIAAHEAAGTEVIRNPHCSDLWAREAVRSPFLLAAVQAVLGPDVAVENTFVLIKWPGRTFVVPWHQDGINDHIELDPARSVAVWLALTDATEQSGCLRILPGSHRGGYLPYDVETDAGQERGRALGVHVPDDRQAVPFLASAGQGVLMDPRTLHSSGPNTGSAIRIGLNIRFVAPGGYAARGGIGPSLAPIAGSSW